MNQWSSNSLSRFRIHLIVYWHVQRNLKSILKITLFHVMHISILICIICLIKLEFIPGRSFWSSKQRTKFSVSSLNKINWGHRIHQLTFITPSVKVFPFILSQTMKGKKYQRLGNVMKFKLKEWQMKSFNRYNGLYFRNYQLIFRELFLYHKK